ncbi:MAG: hypothetical protein HYU64_11035 [Armatimonadetes bacterium]|nr:hypothetical protein [Armatimonadota bacterium]
MKLHEESLLVRPADHPQQEIISYDGRLCTMGDLEKEWPLPIADYPTVEELGTFDSKAESDAWTGYL